MRGRDDVESVKKQDDAEEGQRVAADGECMTKEQVENRFWKGSERYLKYSWIQNYPGCVFIHFLHHFYFPENGPNGVAVILSLLESQNNALCFYCSLLHGSLTHKHGQLLRRNAAISSKLRSPCSKHVCARAVQKKMIAFFCSAWCLNFLFTNLQKYHFTRLAFL